MFAHWVLFEIKKKNVPTYKVDCRLWAREAKKHAGFLDCRILIRTNAENQYASIYVWKSKTHHERFMRRHHDRLVALSKCPVKVLGYFNFRDLTS